MAVFLLQFVIIVTSIFYVGNLAYVDNHDLLQTSELQVDFFQLEQTDEDDDDPEKIALTNQPIVSQVFCPGNSLLTTIEITTDFVVTNSIRAPPSFV